MEGTISYVNVEEDNDQTCEGSDFTTYAKELPLRTLEQHAGALVKAVSRGVEREAESYNFTHLDSALIRLFLV